MSFVKQVRDGEPIVGGWLSLGDPTVAEVVAELGFDFVVIDTEHSPTSLDTVAAMVRAVDAAGRETGTVVRLPWNDPVVIKRVLDIGVSGVMAPMVGSAGEAEDLVAATRYPPDGIRGVAGGRASRYGLDLPGYFDRANDGIAVIAQIETAEGLGNVREIAAVDGLDGLFMGPADLSANLGVFSDRQSETFTAAVEEILAAGRETGTAVSTLAIRPADVERWVGAGFDFIMAGTDRSYLMAGAVEAKQTFEAAATDRDR